jgi:hypothetical protein
VIHLVHLLALLAGGLHRLVGLDLVIGQLAAAVVAVHGDQEPARGVGNPVPAGGAAEPAEHLRVDDAQPGASQHRDRQLRDHRHVQRHPVTCLQAQRIAQQRRELIHLPVQLRVADRHVLIGFQLRHEDDRGLVRIRRGVPVHAVI